MALLLCGCAHDPNSLAGTPPLAVSQPTICERVLAPVALPPVKATDDARMAFLKDDAALITAHNEIEQGRGCIAEQRQLYAAAGGKP